MIVQFVEAHTQRPMGMAFHLCEEHWKTQKVPENRMLKILAHGGTGQCDSCGTSMMAAAGRMTGARGRYG